MTYLNRFCILALSAGRLWALDNGILVRNNYTEALTDHPIWFGRWFAQGEIPNYCRPYATPGLGPRVPVAEWQCDVKNRWRDAIAVRTITGVRTSSQSWSNGAGLISIVVTAPDPNGFGQIATVNFSSPHGLSVGDRLVLTGNPTDADLKRDNYVVYEVPSSTVLRFIPRSVSVGTYGTNITVTNAIDPMEPNALRFYAANHGFYKGEQVTISGADGVPQANGTFTVTAVTRNEFVVNATGSGTYSGGGTATGPDNGSVRFALVAMKASVPQGGGTKIDFVDDPNPSSAGDAAATFAAGADKAAMMSAAWNAQLDVTANVRSGSNGTVSTNARSMLADWNEAQSYCGPRYWIRGPVMTRIILEYNCSAATNAAITIGGAATALPYDFGFKIGEGSTITQAIATTAQTQFTLAGLGDIEVGTRLWFSTSGIGAEVMVVTDVSPTCTYGTGINCLTVTRGVENSKLDVYSAGKVFGLMQWQDASSAGYKGVHPSFQLTFVAGWPGVQEKLELANNRHLKLQTLWYAPTLKTGPGLTPRLAFPEFKHAGGAGWRTTVWDGADPEFYCSGGAGTDPDNCAGTGGGTRSRKYFIDHNTPYLIYARALPQWKLYSGLSTNDPPWRTSFQASDRGAIAVDRLAHSQLYPGSVWPGKYTGTGTWGAAFSSYNYGLTDFPNSTQEGAILDSIEALWIQSWDLDGYEIVFGDSVPGGAGNSAVQNYIPWQHTEDDTAYPRPYYAGFSDEAFGRELSLYARPTWVASPANYTISAATYVDRPTTACGPGVAPLYVHLSNGNWPCHYANVIQGLDGWAYESAHQNDWSWLPYLITGDYSYLRTLQLQAAWNCGNNHSYRNIGKSWCLGEVRTGFDSSNADHIRQESQATRQILRAAMLTPNVPQFGSTVPSVETFYWNEKVWDFAFFKEGGMDIADGFFQQQYPAQFTDNCTTYSTSSPDLWRFARCSQYQDIENALGWPVKVAATFSTGGGNAYLNYKTDGTGVSDVSDWWMYTYSSNYWAHAEEAGWNQFHYVRSKLGILQINLSSNRYVNPYHVAMYRSPTYKLNTPPGIGTYYAGMNEIENGYPASWSMGPTGRTRFKDDQEWEYMDGTTGGTPLGYVAQWTGAMSFLGNLSGAELDGCTAAEKPPIGCTGTKGYRWFLAAATSQDQNATNPKYNFVPRQVIAGLSVSPGSTSAIASYTAPTQDPCTYSIGTGVPASTLDTADVMDSGGPLSRRVVLTGLNPGTEYHLRLTCGTRLGTSVAGTNRSSITFTTRLNETPTTLAVTVGAVPGATQVLAEYGDTSSLGNSLNPILCASGCSPNLPATTNRLIYYRLIYKDDLGSVVAQGDAVPIIP